MFMGFVNRMYEENIAFLISEHNTFVYGVWFRELADNSNKVGIGINLAQN